MQSSYAPIASIAAVEQLTFGYPDRPLFQGLGVQIPPGITLVRGDESAGKTTLLRLLAGELAPQAGVVKAPRGAECFWVDVRHPDLDPQVAQQWLQAVAVQYPQWDSNALASHIEAWDLAQHLHKPIYQLSTGTRRKLVMAAALVSGAALTLLDEPLSGLDKPSIRYLQACLAEAASQAPKRAIVVAHYESLPGVPWEHIIDLPGY